MIATETAEIATSNQQRLQQFLQLYRDLHDSGIEVLPLKGMDLLLRAYPSPELRPMDDVDLLVRPEQVRALQGFFSCRGYQAVADDDFAYQSPDGSLLLDIVRRIWYLRDPSEPWRRTVERSFDGTKLRLLHPEDTLLYSIAYSVAHRGSLDGLFVRDLDFLLKREGAAIQWDRWVEQVRRLGLEVPVFCGLSYARSKGIWRVPAEVEEALRPSSWRERTLGTFYSRMIADEGRPRVSYLWTFFEQPTLAAKIGLLAKKLAPSRETMELRFGKMPFFRYVVLLLVRPFTLVAKAVVLVLRDCRRLFR